LESIKTLPGVELHNNLRDAIVAFGRKRHARQAYGELELAFSRVHPNGDSVAGEILSVDSGEFSRQDLGFAEPTENNDYSDRLAKRDVEIAKLRAQLAMVSDGSGAATAMELNRLREELSEVRRARDEAGTEVGRLEGQATELRRQLNDERRRVRELEKLQSELVIARTRQSELQSQLDLLKKKHADVELELQLELKQERESHSAMQIELAQAQELIATLEAELESAKNEPFDFREAKGTLRSIESLPSSAEELKDLLIQSEQDKLRILADAQMEIERLTHQEEMLREELESAGEMIERMGKELELS
jgi:chromosome segregation ATPase